MDAQLFVQVLGQPTDDHVVPRVVAKVTPEDGERYGRLDEHGQVFEDGQWGIAQVVRRWTIAKSNDTAHVDFKHVLGGPKLSMNECEEERMGQYR
jgi:hypothetical protein